MNGYPDPQDGYSGRDRRGVVLLITLVILVILSTLGYTLSAQVAARRRRDRYIIDYAQTQYACTSGIKCALVLLNDLEPSLISRPNEPDFSDIFAMSEPAYQELLAQMGVDLTTENEDRRDTGDVEDAEDINDLDDAALAENDGAAASSVSATIRGPYGSPWPLVAEALEFEIATAKVKIEIEDENAKYPLGWAFIDDEKVKPQADVGFVTFCEWMGYTAGEIEGLREDLAVVARIRPFKTEFKPITEPVTRQPTSLRSRTQSRTSARTASAASSRKTVSAAEQMTQQSMALAGLFHSSLMDRDLLARPTIVSESRNESALKYLGLWGTQKVNINTAPRHVLEAVFAFGSVADAPKIADAIVTQRRVKPFSDLDELKNGVSQFSDKIEDAKDFITTTSDCFTVRVTAVSGVARTVAVLGATKEGTKVKRIAVISD